MQFAAALDEMVAFHLFILATNSKMEEATKEEITFSGQRNLHTPRC